MRTGIAWSPGPQSPCRVRWCVPVVPAPWEDHLSPGVLGYSTLCRSGIHTNFDINIVTSVSRGPPSCLRRGEPVQVEMKPVKTHMLINPWTRDISSRLTYFLWLFSQMFCSFSYLVIIYIMLNLFLRITCSGFYCKWRHFLVISNFTFFAHIDKIFDFEF